MTQMFYSLLNAINPWGASSSTTQPCYDKDTWTEIEYLHADGTPVLDAKQFLKTAGGIVFSEHDVEGQPIRVNIPKGSSKLVLQGGKDPVFAVLPAHQSKAPAQEPLPEDFVASAIEAGAFGKIVEPWGATAITDEGAFRSAPTFGKIACNAVLAESPRLAAPGDAEDLAALLFKLILRRKPDVGEWAEAFFNRAGAIDDTDGPAAAAVLHELHVNPKLDLMEMVARLNSLGKGNAVKWLGWFHEHFSQFKAEITGSLTNILGRLEADCRLLATPDPRIHGTVRCCAAHLTTRLEELRGNDVVRKMAWQTLGDMEQLLEWLTQDVYVLRVPVVMEGKTTLQQPRVAFRQRQAPAIPLHWLAIEHLDADNQPVAGAKFVVLDTSETTVAKGTLDEGGFTLLTDLPGGGLTVAVHDDPDEYEIDPSHACKESAPVLLPADLLDTLIAGKNLRQVKKLNLFRWTPCSIPTAEATGDTLTFGGIARGVVAKHSPFLAAPGDDLELAELLQPLLLVRSPGPELWRRVALNRAGAIREQWGKVLQAILLRLGDGSPPAALADLYGVLNALGKGNAHRLLKRIRDDIENRLVDDIQANLKAILGDLQGELTKLVNADKEHVNGLIRAYATTVCGGIERLLEGSTICDAIAPALTPLTGHLGTLLDGPKPSATGCTLDRVQVVARTKGPVPALPGAPVVPVRWALIGFTYPRKKSGGPAQFVVEDGDQPIAEGTLNPSGVAFLADLPDSMSLTWRYAGGPDFVLDPEHTLQPAPQPPLTDGFVQRALDADCLAHVDLAWSPTAVTDEQDFGSAPTLGKIARALIAAETKVQAAALEDELVDTLLYPLIMSDAPTDELLTAIALNRAGALSADGAVVAAVLCWLHAARGGAPQLGTLVKMLHTAGHGDAIAWLGELAARLDALANDVRNHLHKALNHLANALKPIAEAEEGKITGASRGYVSAVLASVKSTRGRLGKNPFQKLFAAWKNALEALVKAPPERHPLKLVQANFVQEAESPLHVRRPGDIAVPSWIELQLRYADGTGVGGAHYHLDQRAGGAAFSEGDLSDAGFAFVLVPPGSALTYRFGADPNAFEIPEERRSTQTDRGPLEDAYVANLLISGEKPRVRNLVWGTDSELEHFDDAPSLGGIARNAVVACTPYLTDDPDRDEEEMVDVLHGWMMGNGIAPALRPLTTRAVMNRLGCALGEDGRVIQAIFVQLAGPLAGGAHAARQSALVELLGSVGRGDALGWLKALHADMPDHIAAIQQNLKDILNAIRRDLAPLSSAHLDLVDHQSRRYVAHAWTRAGEALGRVNAEVDAVLNPLVALLGQAVNAVVAPVRHDALLEQRNRLDLPQRALADRDDAFARAAFVEVAPTVPVITTTGGAPPPATVTFNVDHVCRGEWSIPPKGVHHAPSASPANYKVTLTHVRRTTGIYKANIAYTSKANITTNKTSSMWPDHWTLGDIQRAVSCALPAHPAGSGLQSGECIIDGVTVTVEGYPSNMKPPTYNTVWPVY
ncbi:EndoU domain-containing protein [Sorangium sp. So ce134]